MVIRGAVDLVKGELIRSIFFLLWTGHSLLCVFLILGQGGCMYDNGQG